MFGFKQITKAEKLLLVEALRSGKFEQGRHRLRSGPFLNRGEKPRHCCIGVQLELRGVMIPLNESTPEAREIYEQSGILIEDRTHMIQMNDGDWKSFEEIADWCEANLQTID